MTEELPPHDARTYYAVGSFFTVGALVAAVFGYLGIRTAVRDTGSTGHTVADSFLESSSGILSVETGWVALGIAVLAAAAAIACFWRAAHA